MRLFSVEEGLLGEQLPEGTKDRFPSEACLQRFLEVNIRALWMEALGHGDAAYSLGREIPTRAGSIDILAVATDGAPVVVETKLEFNHEIRRTVVGQALDYAAHLRSVDWERLVRSQWENGLNTWWGEAGTGGVAESDLVAAIEDAVSRDDVQVIIIADRIPATARRIIQFVGPQLRSSGLAGVELRMFSVGDGHIATFDTVCGGGRTVVRGAREFLDHEGYFSELGKIHPSSLSAHRELAQYFEEELKLQGAAKNAALWYYLDDNTEGHSSTFARLYKSGKVGFDLHALNAAGNPTASLSEAEFNRLLQDMNATGLFALRPSTVQSCWNSTTRPVESEEDVNAVKVLAAKNLALLRRD